MAEPIVTERQSGDPVPEEDVRLIRALMEERDRLRAERKRLNREITEIRHRHRREADAEAAAFMDPEAPWRHSTKRGDIRRRHRDAREAETKPKLDRVRELSRQLRGLTKPKIAEKFGVAADYPYVLHVRKYRYSVRD